MSFEALNFPPRSAESEELIKRSEEVIKRSEERMREARLKEADPGIRATLAKPPDERQIASRSANSTGMAVRKAREGDERSESTAAAYVRSYLAALPTGHIAYAIPDKPLKVGKTEKFEARVSRTVSEDLTKGLQSLGTPEVKQIKVDTFMRLALEGAKFDIKLEGGADTAKKIVDEEDGAVWVWNLTPLEGGDQELALIAYVRIKLPNGGEESKEYQVFRRPFHVRVDVLNTAKAFVTGNWQWFVTTLLGGGVWAGYKKKWMAKYRKWWRTGRKTRAGK